MRTPQACVPLLAVLALSFVTQADDSWKNKPYTEWNEKEIREVLERSPWSRRENLMVVRSTVTNINPPCNPSNPRCFNAETDSVPPPDPNPRRRTASPEAVQAAQDKRAASVLPPADGVAGTAVIRWASAQTVREAMKRVGDKLEKVADMQVNEPPPLPPSLAYILYVDLRVHLIDLKRIPKEGVLTRAMMRRSSLVMKSTGERIYPVRVTAAPLPEFDDRKELAIAAYYVYFLRQRDGKPVLPAKEKTVRFECPFSPSTISTEFSLKSMKRTGAPDL